MALHKDLPPLPALRAFEAVARTEVDLGEHQSGLIAFTLDDWDGFELKRRLGLQGINIGANGVAYSRGTCRHGVCPALRASASARSATMTMTISMPC